MIPVLDLWTLEASLPYVQHWQNSKVYDAHADGQLNTWTAANGDTLADTSKSDLFDITFSPKMSHWKLPQWQIAFTLEWRYFRTYIQHERDRNHLHVVRASRSVPRDAPIVASSHVSKVGARTLKIGSCARQNQRGRGGSGTVQLRQELAKKDSYRVSLSSCINWTRSWLAANKASSWS